VYAQEGVAAAWRACWRYLKTQQPVLLTAVYMTAYTLHIIEEGIEASIRTDEKAKVDTLNKCVLSASHKQAVDKELLYAMNSL
jgi:hypothetical protein